MPTGPENAKTKIAPEAPSRFEGFADTKGTFFRQLAKNQDREWFAAHKQEYVEGWEQPMHALLTELRTRLDGVYPDLELLEPKIFRIHRDVRFSKDKTPYKTHVSGSIHVKAGGARRPTETPAPLYLQIGTECLAAAGLYIVDAPALAKYRDAVLDETKGAELAKITSKITKAGYQLGAHEKMKNVPRGVDPEHPRAELLKHKGLIVDFPEIDRKALASRGFLDEVVVRAKVAAPLVRWLTFNVVV